MKNQIMKNQIMEISIDSENQFSSFMMDHLKPCTMRTDYDISLKTDYYIKPYLQTIKLILDLGELEHTSDWDPSIKITLIDGRTFETECGYYEMRIQDNHLLLEDAEGQEKENNEDGPYHIISIQDLHSIELIRN